MSPPLSQVSAAFYGPSGPTKKPALGFAPYSFGLNEARCTTQSCAFPKVQWTSFQASMPRIAALQTEPVSSCSQVNCGTLMGSWLQEEWNVVSCSLKEKNPHYLNKYINQKSIGSESSLSCNTHFKTSTFAEKMPLSCNPTHRKNKNEWISNRCIFLARTSLCTINMGT